MSECGLYLYGVVLPQASLPAAPVLVEPSGGSLRLVTSERAGLITSPVTAKTVPVTRANLDAHQAVVEAAFGTGVTLPFRFGMVAPSEEVLAESWLPAREEALARELESFVDLVEMRLTVRYVGDGAVAEVMRQNGRARELQSRIRRSSAAASYYDRIALGELVATGLASLRERDSRLIVGALGRLVVSEHPLGTADDEVVCRRAYLLERSKVATFDALVGSLGQQHGSRLAFDVVGPLAPWDFVAADGRFEGSSERTESRAPTVGGT